MRWFQIWSQNSNRIRFDSFLAQNCQKWAKSGTLPISDSFFWPKNGPNLIRIWILRTDLESSHHFAYFRHPFDIIFAFWFFDPPCIFKKIEIKFATPKTAWNRFFHAPSNSACLKPWETTRPTLNFQSWCFLNNPNIHQGIHSSARHHHSFWLRTNGGKSR